MNNAIPFASMFAQVDPGPIFASGGAGDYSSVFTGLSANTAVTAIIAAAALIALVVFAAWVAKKVASFFGGDDEQENATGDVQHCAHCEFPMDECICGDHDPEMNYELLCRRCGDHYADESTDNICEDCER